MSNPIHQYRQTSAGTADPGKVVVMVYDACIQWCDRAIEAPRTVQGIEPRARAVNKVLDGLIELTAALDRPQGGEIAENLLRLYEFMSWKLTQGLATRDPSHFKIVRDILSELREAWSQAADEVRRTAGGLVTRHAAGVRLSG